MDNAARARQRILALFLPLTAVLYIGAEGLTPKGLDQVVQTRATAFKVLAIATKHPAQLYLAGSLALLALGLWLSRMRRSPRWSETAVRPWPPSPR
jgi:hypothetical protein